MRRTRSIAARIERLEQELRDPPEPEPELTDEEWMCLGILTHVVRKDQTGRLNGKPITDEEWAAVQAELERWKESPLFMVSTTDKGVTEGGGDAV